MSRETRRKRAEERRAQREIRKILNALNKGLKDVGDAVEMPAKNPLDKGLKDLKMAKGLLYIKYGVAQKLAKGQDGGRLPSDPIALAVKIDRELKPNELDVFEFENSKMLSVYIDELSSRVRKGVAVQH